MHRGLGGLDDRWGWWLSALIARDVIPWPHGDATATNTVLGEGERLLRSGCAWWTRQRSWIDQGGWAGGGVAVLGGKLASVRDALRDG